MGNEKSVLKGLEIDDKALEITDFWTHHSSKIQGPNPQNLSIFISEPSLHSDASFGKPSPLEKAAKNLMVHRHPYILKYVSSWSKGSKFFLATEEVKPLVQVIGTQTTLQICVGLYSILGALLFLHQKASSSHNNVCSSSIYVTSEGGWKLGGLEYLCQISELNLMYLRKIKMYRYENAISPDEETSIQTISDNPSAIDKYAFAVLAEDVLKIKNEDDVPGLSEFKQLCKEKLKDTTLDCLVHHPFFNHNFMNIYAFLTELPLKNENEKEEFFSKLVSQLQNFPEKIVAEQLGKLLLSRMVLLDATAQTKFLPIILKPKENDDDSGLLSISTFQACLVPQLLQVFCVRDTPIRLLLLLHLHLFVKTFQIEDLRHRVLPELLVGIKDTDDYLVSTTLRALADLVPILGAATVIGGNRGKLFTDGRPNKHQRNKKNRHVRFSSPCKSVNTTSSPIGPEMTGLCLPERPSPDGGEDKSETNFSFAEEENWSDWDAQENESEGAAVTESGELVLTDEYVDVDREDKLTSTRYPKKPIISDISELDIKHLKPMNENAEDIDFFTDMEPVIQKTQTLRLDEADEIETETKKVFNVSLAPTATEVEGDGWTDGDLDDWDVENKC
ncbi:PREDICTED: protein-associating with the carboxyl-terminal domain of ezrin [Ceratosolen solmsi marchali]|uniref:Protein-associating with the carboxyl-terminal domain of ezrin n=1 Tax=Ceratosolen solmsi marchali TaxID=326594 RepID=A0AAJ6YM53_9HYME|nr:PREDICTED: protein-associating with the carboxyl-terminal domain of ezrin [Ceratosolen solmsi marchali]